MASFTYLWSERAKFTMPSQAFINAWAKRFFSIPELLKRNLRRHFLTKKGAFIHHLAEIGNIRAEGKFSYLKVGKMSFIGRVHIALHDNVIIGERVCINDNVEILTASHDVYDPYWKHVKGSIIIEDYVWIGTGAMILPGVHIGRGAVVGARAVVTKSVAPDTIVVGNPAKAISKRRIGNLNYNPCEFLAANRAWLIG